MTEVPAIVESEHTPEPKWPERIIVCHARTLDGMGDFDLFVPRVSENAEDEAKGWCNSQGYTAYRILRVAPPHKPGVDWASVVTECGDAIMGPEWSAVRAAIERYPVLRVQPPVERRVSIDFEGIKRAYKKELGVNVDMNGSLSAAEQEIVLRHARIVEEPKP